MSDAGLSAVETRPLAGDAPRARIRSKRPRIRFGFDAFIAHNRASAASYARKLYDSLTSEYSLVCSIDVVGFVPGTRLRSRTLLSLFLTHMLIVVFTKEARASVHVRGEVALFLRLRKWLFRNRPISILDVQGDWKRLLDQPTVDGIEPPWAQLLKETRAKFLIYETETDFASGPSPRVCARYGEWKAFERLRKRDMRVVLSSVALALVLGIATVVSVFALNRARSDARLVEDARKSAVALKLGAQAQQAASRPDGLGAELGVLLAIESANREANADAYAAAMDGLALLPKPLRTVSLATGGNQQTWLSSNGRFVLMRNHGNIDVKRTADGTTIGTIASSKGRASLVSFSTDGDFVLTAEIDPSASEQHPRTVLRVFRLADSIETATARVDAEFAGRGVLGPTGTTFAIYVNSGKSLLYGNFGERGRAATLQFPSEDDNSFPVLSEDGLVLAVVRSGRPVSQVGVWDTRSLKPGTSSAQPHLVLNRTANIASAALSRDGRLLATAEQGQTGARTFAVRIWSTVDGLEQTEPILHPKAVQSMAFSTDGQHLMTVDDFAIRIWTTTGVLYRVDQRHGLWDERVDDDSLPDEERTFFKDALLSPVAIRENELAVLRARNSRYNSDTLDETEIFDTEVDLYSFEPARSRLVSDVVAESNPQRVASVSNHGEWVAVATKTGAAVYARDGSATLVPWTEAPRSLAFSPNGDWLVMTGEPRMDEGARVTLVRTRTGDKVWQAIVPGGSHLVASVSNTGFVAVGVDLPSHHPGVNTFVFDYPNGERHDWALGVPLPEYSPEHPEGWTWPGVPDYSSPLVSISPDGHFLLMQDEVLNARDGARVVAVPKSAGTAVAYDSDGHRIYLENNKKISTWDPRTGAVGEARFGVAEATIASEGLSLNLADAASMLVRRARDGAPLARVVFGGDVVAAALTADGTTIVASGTDARVRAFRWQPEEVATVAKEYLTRTLTDNERTEYLLNDAAVIQPVKPQPASPLTPSPTSATPQGTPK